LIKNEVMYKTMKDMVMYLTPYQLKKLKTILQDKLENVEGCSSKTLKYYREILEKFIKDIDKTIKEITTDEIQIKGCKGNFFDIKKQECYNYQKCKK